MSYILPTVNSKKFDKLHYKEKLYILNLYFHDRSTYIELCGLPPEGLSYIDNSLSSIFNLACAPASAREEEFPINYIGSCWCAYITRFSEKWWDPGLSPIDGFGFSHRYILGIHFFNFPLISFDLTTSRILRWLVKEPHKTRQLSDIFYYTVKLRAAYEYFGDREAKFNPTEIWNLSVTHLNQLFSIEEVNGSFPIIEENSLADLVEEDSLVPYFYKVRTFNGRFFIPLLPAELFAHGSFKISDWDFVAREQQ